MQTYECTNMEIGEFKSRIIYSFPINLFTDFQLANRLIGTANCTAWKKDGQ